MGHTKDIIDSIWRMLVYKFINNKENFEVFNKVSATGRLHKIKIGEFAIKDNYIYFDVGSEDGIFALTEVVDEHLLPLFIKMVENVSETSDK